MSRAGIRSPIRVRDRQTDEIFEETVFGGNSLRFLYHQRQARGFTDHIVSHPWTNRVYGWWQRRRSSRQRIPGFVESLGIDPSDAELPLDQYCSLDDFFTRRLRADARPVDRKATHLVAPADGRALAYSPIAGPIPIKGSQLSLPELIGDASLARRYAGGAALIVRLAPADYHRFHFPDDGLASSSRQLGHRLHSVHPIALSAGAPSFHNKRSLSLLSTDLFGDLLQVEVGAMLVGTIVQTYSPGKVERGAEKGMFRFGGSTVILIAERSRLRLDDDLLKATARGIESYVRVGTRIGRSWQ